MNPKNSFADIAAIPPNPSEKEIIWKQWLINSYFNLSLIFFDGT
jgi:hypothetical protein